MFWGNDEINPPSYQLGGLVGFVVCDTFVSVRTVHLGNMLQGKTSEDIRQSQYVHSSCMGHFPFNL